MSGLEGIPAAFHMPDTSVWGTCLTTQQLIHSPSGIPSTTQGRDKQSSSLKPGQGAGNSQIWEETRCAHLPKGDGHSLVTWGREEHCMEGNLGNSALYPGLVPAESRLTSCFCLGKENKPSLGVQTSWEMQSCQSPLSLVCIASLGTHQLFKLPSSTPGRAQQSRVCGFSQRKRVVRKLTKNHSHVLLYFTQISPLIDLNPFLLVLHLGSSHTIPAHPTGTIQTHVTLRQGKQASDDLNPSVPYTVLK